ncbi:MAG: bifunctional [glutamate--ammonia ligase]-adenylyl-L-tyrosine phosphorylase/[glutamate--ammonia-ligase] adenylyltransferase, partial [Gammaproteobacteria bacterium]
MDTPPPATIRPLLKDFPPALSSQVEHAWEQYLTAAREQGIEPPRSTELLRVLYRVWGYSEFIARSCIGQPALLPGLLHSGDLLRDYAPTTYQQQLATALRSVKDEEALGSSLRQIRQREMVRIAWRDLAGWADLAETLRDLSLLAEAVITAALERLHHWQCRALGTPYDESGKQAQQLVVLAMGKLGAQELNFSSDVDLIFAYPSSGETRGRRPRLSNEEFFVRLGQRLITLLDTPTAGGRVYRVDMRLRPYGNSGPLAMSFDALEEYYQSQGREWERYAMIKARPVAGDLAAGEQLLALLQPFVYRRYLDYNALAALREMKAMINREVSRKSLQDNIKIGPGGIREIEFTGQVFQLIRGGREPALRAQGILEVLRRLGAGGHLPPHAVSNLSAAYVFLRRTENRLQAYGDRQTHTLPRDEEARQRLALSMNFPQWPAFASCLARHRRRVHEHFEAVFASPQGEDRTAPGTDTGTDTADRPGDIWLQPMDETEAQACLVQAGFADGAEALRRIRLLRDSYACRALSNEGRRRLDRLMPLLLTAVAATPQPDRTLPRLLDLIEAVARRTTYLALLEENPMALSQLVRLCAASPWIAQMLRDHPLLLDELLDPRSLYAPLQRAALEQQLEALLARIPSDDQEQQLETLRYFKQANVLRVAAADLMEIMPLMAVSDHLTAIAEV